MGNRSSIPAVIDYLVSRLTTLLGPIGVVVTDGPPQPPQDVAPDIVCIGYSGTELDEVVDNTLARQQMTTSPDRETYTITSLVSSWQGNDVDMKVCRDQVFEIINRISDELSRDQTLGGIVMRIRMQTEALMQVQTLEGAVATARFVFGVDAFTR